MNASKETKCPPPNKKNNNNNNKTTKKKVRVLNMLPRAVIKIFLAHAPS